MSEVPWPEVTYLEADEFAELVASLDEPDDCSGLLAALAREV